VRDDDEGDGGESEGRELEEASAFCRIEKSPRRVSVVASLVASRASLVA